MSQKINQLCNIIATHPSKINLLNEAIKLALTELQPGCFRPIIQLMQSFANTPEIIKFRDNKLQIIFNSLLRLYISNSEAQLFELIQSAFRMSNQKEILVEQFVSQISDNAVAWIDWPAILLISAFEKLAEANQSPSELPLDFIAKFIIQIPHFKELNIAEDLQEPFKKSFQKLLISTLGNPTISRELLHEIYHSLGQKVLSKLQNPLILSNHCLEKFANDSELQIEVLSCIFLLVGKYGLELEQFYPKLERLVTKRENYYSTYELPNSRRFFKLLEVALRSSRVPFKTISTFAHILIKQIAGEQSEFAFWSLSFVVNLTKKHRKLLDEIPLIPELKVLKYHYNPKIRALVQELSKNMNKLDYLQIEEFASVNFAAICEAKMASLLNSLENDEMQFKIPAFEDPI